MRFNPILSRTKSHRRNPISVLGKSENLSFIKSEDGKWPNWRGVSDTARQLWIPLPPLAEQKRFVAKVEELLTDVERLKKGAA